MKMRPTIFIIAILATIVLSSSLQASFPESFGSSAFNSQLANQASFDDENAANLYYAPALTAYSKKLRMSFFTGAVDTQFKDIDNITIENSTNSNTNSIGSANNDYETYYSTVLHFVVPINYKNAGNIGFSLFTPLGKFTETDSGDPSRPEYVMYRSRYKRTQIHLSYAHLLNNDWAFSLGTHIGFQAGADVFIDAGLNGASYPSNGSARTDIRPSIGAIVSVSKKTQKSIYYFNYQQEMKSNLETNSFSETHGATNIIARLSINSMLYYDPHMFRIGMSHLLTPNLKIISSLEYQLWGGYLTPTLRLGDSADGSLIDSVNYDSYTTRNILIPKIAFELNLSDKLKMGSGLSFRPTPLEGDFSGSGNSIDSNLLSGSIGFSYLTNLLGLDVNLATSFQYHHMMKKTVTKTPGEENGNAGDKIGAPGYEIGGRILAVSAGFNVVF